MSLADQIQRIIYKLKTDGAKEVVRDFESINKAMEGVEQEAIDVDKAIATIGIQADTTQSRLQRMVGAAGSGFGAMAGGVGRVASGLTGAMKGVDDMVKTLGPWNQALELGGKAMKFAGEALDEYAKKSPEAAAEVAKLNKEFGGLKDSAMAFGGGLIVDVVQPLEIARVALAKARGEAVTLEEAFEKAFKHFSSDGATARRGVGSVFSGDIFGGGDAWASTNIGMTDILDKLELATKKRLDAIKLSEAELKVLREQAAARKMMHDGYVAGGANVARTQSFTKVGDNLIGRAAAPDLRLGATANVGQFDAGGFDREAELLRGIEKQIDAKALADTKATGARRMGYLETAFGPVEQFDVYKQGFEALGGTFTAFSEAVGASYEAIVTGQGSVTKAFRNILADGMMALGKSSVVRALSETALGFGSLAIGSPTAAAHFKSAGLHAAVAVAAGLAANALGTSAQGAASEKAASEKAKAEEKAKEDREKAGGGGDGKPGHSTVIVAYMDPYANQPEHIRKQQAEAMVRNVMGNGVVENS